MYNVNIYYSEDEVHDAFKNYYNVVKQYSDVHIFTKSAMPFSLYGEDKNVFVHSPGSLWVKLKAWITGEEKFEQQFSQLDIPKENIVRYKTIINKGGIIVVSAKDESIVPLIIESNESKNPVLIENITPPLNSSLQNDGTPPLEGIKEDFQTTTESTPSIDANAQSNEPSNFINPIEPNTPQQNLYIADVSTTNHVSSENHPQYEYYDDGPRKHNLYSEKLQQLLSENEQIIRDVLSSNMKNKETGNAPANSESSDLPNEAWKPLEDTLRSLTSENQSFMQINNQLNHKDVHLDNLVHFVQQLSADDAIRTFTQNVLSDLNVPTDSTESVLDKDLQAILDKLKSDEVFKPVPFSQDVKKDSNMVTSDSQDSTTEENLLLTEAVEGNPISNGSSHESIPINLDDELLNNTPEQSDQESK